MCHIDEYAAWDSLGPDIHISGLILIRIGLIKHDRDGTSGSQMCTARSRSRSFADLPT